MALRVPLERAKPGRERGRREEEALGFIPPCAFMLGPPHSGQLVTHFLPLCSYTHPINTQSAHVRARNQNSVPPAVTGPRACQCIWAELVGIKGGDQRCQTSKGCSRLNSNSQEREKRLAVYHPGRFSATSMPMKPFINKHNVILITDSFFYPLSLSFSRDWCICIVCVQHGHTGNRMLTMRAEGKKTGSVASNYTGLIGGSVHGLGQGRTGNTKPGVVARATWCRCTVDRLHQGKHADEIQADTH